VAKLRRFILDLAVRGRLVPQCGAANHRVQRKPNADDATDSWSVPDGWNWINLTSLAGSTGLFTDGDWIESKDQDVNGDVRLIQLADVGIGSFRNRSAKFLTRETAERLNCTYLSAGDILIARMPDPLGRACLFPGDPKPSVTAVDVCILRPGRIANSRYIVNAINSPTFAALVEKRAAGTTRSRISRGNLARLSLPFPPLEEQERIAATVDELMALCDRLEAAQAERDLRRERVVVVFGSRARKAKQMAEVTEQIERHARGLPDVISSVEHVKILREAVLHLAVRGRLVPQCDSEEAPLSALKIGANTIGSAGVSVSAPFTVPKNWLWTKVDGCFDVSGGIQKTPSRAPIRKHYPYVGVANVYRGRLDLRTMKRFELTDAELARFRLKAGDILVVEGNGSASEVGRCAMWDSQIADCVHQNHIIRCRPRLTDISPFVLRYLNSRDGMEVMKALAVTSSGLYNLSVGKIREIGIPLPPLLEQRRITAKLDEIMAMCDQLENQIAAGTTASSRLLDALLHEALASPSRQVAHQLVG
jgi:type I restriction enzyme, S subunit